MFARVILGDLFIHGIGGAKYDELGDEIFHQFFGIEPPSYQIVSMTLWPGIPEEPGTIEELLAIKAELRDLEYNPDRHLGSNDPLIQELVDAKRRAVAGPITTRRQRRDRYFAIRTVNGALSDAVADQRAFLLNREAHLSSALRHNKIAKNRAYAAILQPLNRLWPAMTKAITAALAP